MKSILKTLLLSVVASTGCNSGDELSPYLYGIAEVKIAGKQSLYFKREVRGMNYDVLCLSTNKDPCAGADSKDDDVFSNFGGERVYYKIENDSLVLFSWTKTPSDKGRFQINVIPKELDPLERVELKKAPEKQGISYLDVKLDDKIKCR